MKTELAMFAVLAMAWVSMASSYPQAEVPPPGEEPGGIIMPPGTPPEPPSDDSGDPDIPMILAGPAPVTSFTWGLTYMPGNGLCFINKQAQYEGGYRFNLCGA